MKKYLSISQVAKILGVSTETLRRWDNDGKFKSSRNPINNYRVYSEEQVENFIREMQLEFDFSPRVKDENQTLNISRNPEITPYFETGYGKLYHYDAVEFLTRSQAETSQYANGKKKKYHWTPHPLGAKPKDVFEIPTISNGAWEKYPHVTQKPVELLRKIILASSNPDSIILDPFGGSGTTYAVAEAYKRRWIGTELEKEYCEMIKTRLSDKAHIARIASEKDSVSSRKRRKKLRG